MRKGQNEFDGSGWGRGSDDSCLLLLCGAFALPSPVCFAIRGSRVLHVYQREGRFRVYVASFITVVVVVVAVVASHGEGMPRKSERREKSGQAGAKESEDQDGTRQRQEEDADEEEEDARTDAKNWIWELTATAGCLEKNDKTRGRSGGVNRDRPSPRAM